MLKVFVLLSKIPTLLNLYHIVLKMFGKNLYRPSLNYLHAPLVKNVASKKTLLDTTVLKAIKQFWCH